MKLLPIVDCPEYLFEEHIKVVKFKGPFDYVANADAELLCFWVFMAENLNGLFWISKVSSPISIFECFPIPWP